MRKFTLAFTPCQTTPDWLWASTTDKEQSKRTQISDYLKALNKLEKIGKWHWSLSTKKSEVVPRVSSESMRGASPSVSGTAGLDAGTFTTSLVLHASLREAFSGRRSATSCNFSNFATAKTRNTHLQMILSLIVNPSRRIHQNAENRPSMECLREY